jgi:plastocyanin
MQFGKVNTGSPFAGPSDHDQSEHGVDDLVPRSVVIDRGGTVTFNVPPGVHQIAIYKPGKGPEDVNTSIVTTLAQFAGCVGAPVFNAPLVINDAVNREAVRTVPCGQAATRTYTFNTPGKYLVICAFLPHFEIGMYGWVTVRDR